MKPTDIFTDEQPIEIIRVNGDAECPSCGARYRHHALDEVNVSKPDGKPFLRIGCDGTRLRL